MKSPKDRASEKLKDRDFKLNTLLEVSSVINNIDEEVELFEFFKHVLIEKLSLGKGLLLSDYNGWSVNILFGTTYDDEKSILNSCREFNRITVLNNHEDPIISDFDVVIPIYHKSKPLSYLLLADFEGERIEVSPIIRHLPFIQTLTNLIVVAQENKRLFGESIEKAALQKEIELASRMQSMLIPMHMPERKDLDIHALYKPHQVVGGDYYDFFQLNDNETVFCIADVSGKGISAAMLMSNFQAMMHALISFDKDLKRIINSLNQRVAKNANGEKFITLFVAIYNHEKAELTYVNSGHQPPIFLHDGKAIELKAGSPVIGAFDELPHLNVGVQKVSANDSIICFTDGVCEVENENKEEFGTAKLKDLMIEYYKKDSVQLTDAIMQEIISFKGEMEFPDDLALLAIRFIH